MKAHTHAIQPGKVTAPEFLLIPFEKTDSMSGEAEAYSNGLFQATPSRYAPTYLPHADDETESFAHLLPPADEDNECPCAQPRISPVDSTSSGETEFGSDYSLQPRISPADSIDLIKGKKYSVKVHTHAIQPGKVTAPEFLLIPAEKTNSKSGETEAYSDGLFQVTPWRSKSSGCKSRCRCGRDLSMRIP